MEECSEPARLVLVERDRRFRSRPVRADVLPDAEPQVAFVLTVAEIARHAKEPSLAVRDRRMWVEELRDLQPLGRSTPG